MKKKKKKKKKKNPAKYELSTQTFNFDLVYLTYGAPRGAERVNHLN